RLGQWPHARRPTSTARRPAHLGNPDLREWSGHGHRPRRRVARVPGGAFSAVMGRSGSGKSTLMHCGAGLDRPTSGRVLLGDLDLTPLSEARLTTVRRERIGFVFQAFNLVPFLSAWENILLPLRLGGRSPDPAWFGHVVESVGLGGRLSHRPSELSGGQ